MAQPTVDALLILVRDLRDHVAALEAENARRRAEVAALHGAVLPATGGGTRSARGSATRMVRQSLMATWERRGLDPVTAFLALLRAPPPTVEIAPV
jgi:hypothetical protein